MEGGTISGPKPTQKSGLADSGKKPGKYLGERYNYKFATGKQAGSASFYLSKLPGVV